MRVEIRCEMPAVVLAGCLLAANARAVETKPHIDASGVNMQPAYPASALPDREAGAVVLAVAVTADGAVEKISPVKSSGFQDLDEAAVASVMNWRFVPATKDGKAVDGSTLVQVMFNPPDGPSAPPAKAGVQADYLRSDFTLSAASKAHKDDTRPIPCSSGFFSVSMQFTSVNIEPNSISGDSYVSVQIGSGDSYAMITTFPAYYPPRYQFVYLMRSDAKGLGTEGGEAHRFRFKPNFKKPTVARFSWTKDGEISAAVGGEHFDMKLPATPTTMIFSVGDGDGRFTDPRLVCTRS